MSFVTYNQNTPLQFLDRDHLDAERTVIDNYVHDIVKNYGMDILYVSQKKNFPIVPHKEKPTEHDLLFHAYGDNIKPDYNEPFLTRAYIKFENDLFAINSFGLSNDMSINVFLNKTDFALDAAIALADNETIKKTFDFRATIIASKPTCLVSYSDKKVNFNIEFPYVEAVTTKRVTGTLLNFEISPDTIGNKYLYASFNRRYSAKYNVQDSKVRVSYTTQAFNAAANTIDIVGKISCSFVVKNPFKSYIEHERKITPAVGDLIFVQTVDNKFEKIEITEVLSENKTVSGINPLMATYAYQCACKPFIADNATALTELAAATAINANKLETIDNLSQNASVAGDEISHYEHLYVDPNIGNIQQDEIYGGYDAPTGPINLSIVPLKPDLAQTTQNYFKWATLGTSKIELLIPPRIYTFTADELYNQLRNLFDSTYMSDVITKNNLSTSVDYSMFNLNDITSYVSGLNCKFYIDEEDGFGYLEPATMLNMIKLDSSLFAAFCDANPDLVSLVNISYSKGYKSPDGLPYLSSDLTTDYINVLTDKQHSSLVQINGTVYTKNEEDEFVKGGLTTLVVDLRDIERNNLDTVDFNNQMLAIAQYLPTTPSTPAQIDYEFIIGKLLTIYEFDDDQSTKLATNGLDLFIETTDLEGNLYRHKIETIQDSATWEPTPVEPYHDKTVNLRADLSWLSADQHGIYFNPVRGNRLMLAGDTVKFKLPVTTELSYKCDISSEPMSEILTFKASPYYIKPTTDLQLASLANSADTCQYLYIPCFTDDTVY